MPIDSHSYTTIREILLEWGLYFNSIILGSSIRIAHYNTDISSVSVL